MGGFGAAGGTCRASCGAQDQACCTAQGGAAGSCASDLSCIQDKCQPCGEQGQLCCPGFAACGSGLGCIQDSCGQCGAPGQPCCPTAGGGGQNDGCPGTLNRCTQGMCEGTACGLQGQACCPGADGGAANVCSAPGTVCSEGSCVSCGQANQPCCGGPGGGCFTRGTQCRMGMCSGA